jgi:hypothetical protein
MDHDVAVFKPYPFIIGEKIRIEGSPRRGDWQVIGVSEKSVKLKCPLSLREFEWPIFCYVVDKEQGVAWPRSE